MSDYSKMKRDALPRVIAERDRQIETMHGLIMTAPAAAPAGVPAVGNQLARVEQI